MTTQTTTAIQWTADQLNVLEGLKDWYKDANQTAIKVTGTAGVGKTTLLAHFVRFLLEYMDEKVTVLAPTHAALQVLAAKLPDGVVLKTVSQATGQAPNAQNDRIDISFIYRNAAEIEGVVLCDEDSMLSDIDVKILMNRCKKIIFSGDRNQLKPIKKKSGAETLYNPEVMKQLVLTEVLRSNALLAGIANKASKVGQYIPESTDCGSVVRYETTDEFIQAFLVDLQNYPVGDVAYITRTNKEVQRINQLGFETLYPNATTALPEGVVIRLGASSPLGKNNTLAKIQEATLVVQPDGIEYYKVRVSPDSPTVAVILPCQLDKVNTRIEALVAYFQDNNGSEAYADELAFLRDIVPADYPYAFTAHRSQGKSILVVYADSNSLSGKAQFFVAYSRASSKLVVVTRIANTKGVGFDVTENTVWYNKKLDLLLDLPADQVEDYAAVQAAIKTQFPDKTEIHPSTSHLNCVGNRNHASKSAKGWTLVNI